MKFLQLFQYSYLLFAALFLYDAIVNWNTDTTRALVSFGLTILALFLFFFRRKYYQKFSNHKKTKPQ